MEELEGKLAASARHSEHLSAAIGKEQQKVRFFFGHDLQQLSRENLEQLEAFHHSSLAKIQSRLVSPLLAVWRCGLQCHHICSQKNASS